MNLRKLLLSLVTMLVLGWTGAIYAAGPAHQKVAAVPTTVNINEAEAKTLSTVLDGVGLTRAQAIVLYRSKNGKFYSAEELTAVKGIGKGTVTRNASKIVVK